MYKYLALNNMENQGIVAYKKKFRKNLRIAMQSDETQNHNTPNLEMFKHTKAIYYFIQESLQILCYLA